MGKGGDFYEDSVSEKDFFIVKNAAGIDRKFSYLRNNMSKILRDDPGLDRSFYPLRNNRL